MRVAYFQILLGAILSLGFSPAQADVLSFKDWKTSRIAEAKTGFDKIQAEMSATATPAPLEAKVVVVSPTSGTGPVHSPRLPRNEAHLQQARLSIEIAQELNASDYFSLYLTQLKNPTDFREATKKLSPDEVSEILMSVRKQNSVQSRSESGLQPLMIPAAESTGRLL